MFTFRRFSLHDDRCAMKVGTDGVLLGAWAVLPAPGTSDDAPRRHRADTAPRLLDVGCGCGLVALMLAQRFPEAHIDALDIDAAAADQAAENVHASPFAHQVCVATGDFLSPQLPFSLKNGTLYDAIVSNPPFFEETLLAPEARRAQARHTAAGLTFGALTRRSAALLRPHGTMQVIIPRSAETRFHAAAAANGFALTAATEVHTVVRKPAKRVLLRFVKGDTGGIPDRDTLILMQDGQRTPQYADLCRDFYL